MNIFEEAVRVIAGAVDPQPTSLDPCSKTEKRRQRKQQINRHVNSLTREKARALVINLRHGGRVKRLPQ